MKKLLPYIAIIALLAFLFWMRHAMQNEINRYKDNFEQFIFKGNDRLLQLTKKEFRRLQKQQSDTLTRLIMDSLKIRTRHVERIITHEYRHVYDTITVALFKDAKQPQLRRFYKKTDSCLEISGYLPENSDSLVFDKINVNYRTNTLYYWQRSRKFLGIPFGRKKHYSVTQNLCSGETKTQEIQIVKRK